MTSARSWFWGRIGHKLGTRKTPLKFGSLRTLSSGRVQARYTGPDGKRYKAPSTFADEMSAYGWLAEIRKSIELGSWQSPDTPPIPTVGTIVNHWLDQCRVAVGAGDMRETSLVTYTAIAQGRILNCEWLTATPVNELTPVMVARWWEEITTAHPVTKDRNKRAYAKLRTALGYAIEYGYINHNPVVVRAARKSPERKRKNLPATAELLAIMEETPRRYQLAVCLCLFHGLRVGEALGLRARHFESTPDGGLLVRTEGSVSRVPNGTGGVMMKWHHKPKTNAGYRAVPVLAEFVPGIRELLREFTSGPEDLATTTDKGRMVMDTNFRNVFNRARELAGAASEITPHYGRNWLITRLAEAGATPAEIGRILGQEDLSTIVNVYMRVRESRPAELMARVSSVDSGSSAVVRSIRPGQRFTRSA